MWHLASRLAELSFYLGMPIFALRPLANRILYQSRCHPLHGLMSLDVRPLLLEAIVYKKTNPSYIEPLNSTTSTFSSCCIYVKYILTNLMAIFNTIMLNSHCTITKNSLIWSIGISFFCQSILSRLTVLYHHIISFSICSHN